MFSQTGTALSSYLLRIVKNILTQNPRFTRAMGDISITSSNAINFGNLQVLIRDVTTEGTRLSFDYFMSTLTGRAILAQVADKDGSFIEWIAETDATGQTPIAGVYYFNVDSVDEQTRDVALTLESYKWYEGTVNQAAGTKIAFRDGIDATTVTVTDPTNGTTPQLQAAIGNIYLLSVVGGILIKDANGATLTPMTDYWVERTETQVVIPSTIFGVQTAFIPSQFLTVSLVDQDDYTLRPGVDYSFPVSPSTSENLAVQMSAWTPAGQTISVRGTYKADPTDAANLIAPENTLNLTLLPGETIVPDQVFISTQDADHIQVTPNADGTITLPTPLPPGGWCRYEVRALVGQSKIVAKKNAVNKDILPGLRVAIGDLVTLNDQCAILVSPFQTETYHVYGSKPGVSFTLDVKANDPTTADELIKMLMRELLINRRGAMEADGLTIFEASSSMNAGVRDDSGTAPTFTMSLSFTAAADWRVYKPLVTRITGFDVTTVPSLLTFPGKLLPSSRYTCLQATGFIPDYR